ncbi:MAG: RidA family protein [Burkholderiaceae bacterium]
MPLTLHNPATIAPPAGAYSNGVSASGGRWLHIAGQIGLSPDGNMPADLQAQSHNAWRNLLAVLRDADMDVADLVKVNHFLVEAADMGAYASVRSGYLGQARPASTVLIVKALAKPGWLVEIDAVAWRA